MRARSPSSAPPVRREDGSTASTPTVSPRARARATSTFVRVDLPTPGGPVRPITCARAAAHAASSSAASSTECACVSIAASARAIARLSPVWRSERSGTDTFPSSQRTASTCTPSQFPARNTSRRPGCQGIGKNEGSTGEIARIPARFQPKLTIKKAWLRIFTHATPGHP